jgi:hypothetical protein
MEDFFFFRDVHVFNGARKDGDGELLFSFKRAPLDQPTDDDSNTFVFEVREYSDVSVNETTYKVSCSSTGKNLTITFFRKDKEPLVFIKSFPQSDWILVRESDSTLISYAGGHSLNMLVESFSLANAITKKD